MFLKLSTFLSVVLIASSCMSPEKLLNDPSAKRLYFGKSGGFTNIPMEYVLIDNEQLYKMENEKYIHVVKIGKRQAEQISMLIEEAGIDNLQLNEPGNMTYYIRYFDGGETREIKWTDQTQNTKIKDLYKALLSTVNQ
jgi:hypothetical protein